MKKLTNDEIKEIQKLDFVLLKEFKKICEKENIWYSLFTGTMLGAVREKGFIPWDTDVDVCIKYPDVEKFRKAFNKYKPEGLRLNNYKENNKCLQSHDTIFYEEKQTLPGVHLDIYPLVGAPSNEKEQEKFCKYTSKADRILRSKYSKLKECRPKYRPIVFMVKLFLFFIPTKVLKRNVVKRENMYNYDKAEYLTILCNYGKSSECYPKKLFDSMTTASFNGESFPILADYDTYLKRTYGDYMTPKKY